jgi:hypothetical protein
VTRIPGFETTSYGYLRGRLVWAGEGVGTDHPRHSTRPWRAKKTTYDTHRLREGAFTCLGLFAAGAPALEAKGLLLWLTNRPMPFPLDAAALRFDAVRAALQSNDLAAFQTGALRVLGLGCGLTPSGDDFVGGIFFALAHAPRAAWSRGMGLAKAAVRQAAQTSTNVISAALLEDLMDGDSYRDLHELLAALQNTDAVEITDAARQVLRIGASSGADMLAGLLLALTSFPHKN